jgi:hypothetical protein
MAKLPHTNAPLPVRLAVVADSTATTMLDGAWWPRSRDTEAELTTLLTALDERQIPVHRLMINPAGWSDHPRRLAVAGRTVRVGWFGTLDESLLIATAYPQGRLDLLIIAPETPARVARQAMSLAANGSPTARAAEVLMTANEPVQLPVGPPTMETWENEGGHLNGRAAASAD